MLQARMFLCILLGVIAALACLMPAFTHSEASALVLVALAHTIITLVHSANQ